LVVVFALDLDFTLTFGLVLRLTSLREFVFAILTIALSRSSSEAELLLLSLSLSDESKTMGTSAAEPNVRLVILALLKG
jgi:hypothetical protein